MLTTVSGELNRFHSSNRKKACEASRQIKLTLHTAESPLARHPGARRADFWAPPEFVLDLAMGCLPRSRRRWCCGGCSFDAKPEALAFSDAP